ncbi:MAG: SDR family NAD(P)-dependent oxidoreductase [Gammaproteobacteria bacterium]|jgi:NAD(P)-dependent dehydrogenase (short-subunit alcohol dehydrogenase family)|nr:SDR family NAD(P)-dependent oxidoreductase [Gammaproteobacteria bacterium]
MASTQKNREERSAGEKTALVTGASGGIGLAVVEALLNRADTARVFAACRQPSGSEALQRVAARDDRVAVVSLDVTDSASVMAAAESVGRDGHLDLLINTAGILHNAAGMRPEKRLADVAADNLLLAYNVNALGAMRLAGAFEALLRHSHSPRFVCLSARVGSIGDNHLGGWYAYRASKAALNMLLKTLAIEWGRGRPPIVCAALHPGTVATELSAPFTGSRPAHTVFAPAEAAGHLLNVIAGLTREHSGGFYAWDGQAIPW